LTETAYINWLFCINHRENEMLEDPRKDGNIRKLWNVSHCSDVINLYLDEIRCD
jgi:hypothetical protein